MCFLGPRSPWKGGDKRGDDKYRILFHSHLGRYQVMLRRKYVGDMFGYIGSDGYEWSFIFVRNPV